MVDLKNKTIESAFSQRNKHQCRMVTDHKPAWYQLFCKWGARPGNELDIFGGPRCGFEGFFSLLSPGMPRAAARPDDVN